MTTNSEAIRTELINWLTANLKRTGETKSGLAKSIGVSKQAVSKWFTKGLVSKENLIILAKHFRTEPPLDLLSLSPNKIKNPLDYHWTPSARILVEMIMDDQETPQGRAKIESLLKIYDVVNNQIK